MRNRQRAAIDLRQLRRVELCSLQLVEELKALRTTVDTGGLLDSSRRMLSLVEEFGLRHRPIALLGKAAIRAQLATLANARKR